jgi:hypothetical protein
MTMIRLTGKRPFTMCTDIKCEWRLSEDKYSVELFNPGGEDELIHNKRYVIKLGTLNPYQRSCLISVNPALYEYANVQCVSVVGPKSVADIDVFINTFKAVDLKVFEWLVRIYALDVAANV